MARQINRLNNTDRIKASIWLEKNRDELEEKKTLKQITSDICKALQVPMTEANVESLLDIVGITPYKTHDSSYHKLEQRLEQEKVNLVAELKQKLDEQWLRTRKLETTCSEMNRWIHELQDSVEQLRQQNNDLLRMMSEIDMLVRSKDNNNNNNWSKTPPAVHNGPLLKPLSEN